MALIDDSSSLSSYYKVARQGLAWVANATITAPVAFSTAAGLGGPLLWNNSGKVAIILGVGIGWTTAPTATGAMGISIGTGQTSVPTSTSAIGGVMNLNAGVAATPGCSLFSTGTVANAGKSIIVTHSISIAGTASNSSFVPLDGLVFVPPQCWAAVTAAAAIATLVAQCSLVWAEVPN